MDRTAYDFLAAAVKALATELPGITFGYIGNVGVDRSGPYDDRSWRVFLPHPGRVGTYTDSVGLGSTADLGRAVADWDRIVAVARRQYHACDRS